MRRLRHRYAQSIRLAVAHERRLDHARGELLAAHLDARRCRPARRRRGTRAERDRPAQRRRIAAAGDLRRRPCAVVTCWWLRSTPPLSCKTAGRRAAAYGCAASSAALPTKSRGLVRSTVHARPDSSGLTASSMSCPYRFIPASRRSVSRAPSPHGLTPAACKRLPEVERARGRQRDLETVLAGVAGARDEILAGLHGAMNGFSGFASPRAPSGSDCPDALARAAAPAPRSSPGRAAGSARVARRALGDQRAEPGEVLVGGARR